MYVDQDDPKRPRMRNRARARGASAFLVTLVLATPLLPAPHSLASAATLAVTEGDQARTTVSEVVNQRFPNGERGGLGYKVTHDVLAPMSPEDTFPSVRIDPAEHPNAFDGQWADRGFNAAWIAPKGKFQYTPDAYTIEGGYFDNAIAPINSTNTGGAPLAPGDSVDIAVNQLPADNPLTWDTDRGETDGELEWEVATQSQTVSATYGEVSNAMDVVFVRADLVARRGDFDARDASVRLPPLVVDLPRIYGPGTRGSIAVSQFAPYLHYIRGIEATVLPQSGKAVIAAQARGYIPEAVERTLSGGTRIREWHIPLNILITLSSQTGPLDVQTFTDMSTSGRVWTFDESGRRRLDVPAGGQVLTSAVMAPQVTEPQEGAEYPAPSAAASTSGTLMDDIEAAASIDHTLTEQKTIRIGKRSFDLTIDPDIDGQGILGIRNFDHLRPPRGFFDTSVVPYVTVNGELIKLDRSRLIDLRVIPFDWTLAIGFGSRNDGTPFDDTSSVTERWGRINHTAAAVEAVYDLGDDRYAFLSARSHLEVESDGEAVAARLIVRSFNDEPANVSAVQYMELAEPGPITYDGQVMTTEFTGPGKVLATPSARIVSGATGGSRITIVRAGAPLASQPAADPRVSIDGKPIGVYVTSDVGSTDGSYGTVLVSWLNEMAPQPEFEVPPIGEACISPPVVDDQESDEEGELDVTRAWFDFDGANLHSTIEVARLDEGVIGSPATFRSSWRFEHIGWGVQAARDVAGVWSYRFGLHSSAGSPWGPIGSVPVTGELAYGSPGYIRMSFPTDAALTSSGFLDGEMLRDTGATSFDVNGVQDRAPQGASDVAYGRGADYVIAPCAQKSDSSTTSTSFTAHSQDAGQYSDVALLEARVVDSNGNAIAGREVTFELAGAGSSRTFSATTDGAGVATVTPTVTEVPGSYQLTVRLTADDAYDASADSTTFVVTKEDSATTLSVDGKGKNRALTARLGDPDADAGIAGRTIDFYVDGNLIGSATTDAEGRATLQAPPGHRGGSHDFEARFSGDDYYFASSDRRGT